MNRSKLKQYAPQARQDFIQAVTDRAAHYGLTKKKIEPVTEQGEVTIIAGTPFPRKVGDKRKKLESRICQQGFDQVIEAMAYTWFNRLVAIRYMELHGYLGHGYRVLSHPDGNHTPEIVEHAEHVDLPGLNSQKVIDLKLDGTKEEELYRMLLIAQCNALSRAMPFLFESIDDETELLLPDNLLHSDSLIRTLVNEIPEEDWQEVEIIGWLYQFYISEKKDEVIGKVVKSEDIPAATQLFTPNWIVKYLVQNSLGQQWLATYPNSSLKAQMEYYIEPAEQTPDVQAKLKEITPDSLNPEELTLLDPACGSGHILVEAYDLLKAIYLERGHTKKEIPGMILEKNLFGLEIDDRAAQLAAFALMMKARADDRRIFASGVQPHVLSIQDSKGLDANDITEALNKPILKTKLPPSGELFEEIAEEKSPLFSKKNLAVAGDISQADVAHLIELFEHGKTFGSLIQVPEKLAGKLPAIAQRVEDVMRHGEMFEQGAARSFRPLIHQAQMVTQQYDSVLTNPPYMGSGYFNGILKNFVRGSYKDYLGDLYSCFVVRNSSFARSGGFIGMITIPNWMFLSTFHELRQTLFADHAIASLIHNGRGVWGSDFGSCSFVIRKMRLNAFCGTYRRLFDKPGSVATNDELTERFFKTTTFHAATNDFEKIPGSPIAYWTTPRIRECFTDGTPLGDIAPARRGLATGDNERFIRFWYEVPFYLMGIGLSRDEAMARQLKWFPYNKGGDFQKWFGNNELVVNYADDGHEIRTQPNSSAGERRWRVTSEECYFNEGITWGGLTVATVSFRWCDRGMLFDTNKGPMMFPPRQVSHVVLGFLASKVVAYCINLLNPSVSTQNTDINALPFIQDDIAEQADEISAIVERCVDLARSDWNESETSWGFSGTPVVPRLCECQTIEQSLKNWNIHRDDRIAECKRLETENNQRFIDAYGLHDELSAEVPDDQITLHRPDREEDIQRLISFANGCMMGRYSLNEPGLIYAHSGNEGFDPSRYKTFPADGDGIIPLTEFSWFEDDAAHRFEKFIATAWPKDYLQENLKFVADSLGPRRNENPRDTIRRYLSQGFFKHHLSMYKKRPIYWLFTSGKERGFQALVYLHRYNDGTLARMRTEYVIPLLGKMAARIDHLTDDIAAATSSAHRKRLEKEKDTLTKQRNEVQTFDEKLRHYADQRIKLDLDDGVKVNYGKFGDLLAEVKAVTGKKAME